MAKTVGERLRAYINKPYYSKALDDYLDRLVPEGESEYQTQGMTKRQWDYMIPENQDFFDKYGLNTENRSVVQSFVEAVSRYKYGVRDRDTPPTLPAETQALIKEFSIDADEIERRTLLMQNLQGMVDAANNMAKVMGDRKAYLMARAVVRDWEYLMDPVHDVVVAETLPLLRKQNLYNFNRPPSPEMQDALFDDAVTRELAIHIARDITIACQKNRKAKADLGLFPEEVKSQKVVDDTALLTRIARVSEDAVSLYCGLATRDDFDPARDPNIYLPQVAEIKYGLTPLVGQTMARDVMKHIELIVDKKVQLLRRTGGLNLDLGDLPPERGI